MKRCEMLGVRLAEAVGGVAETYPSSLSPDRTVAMIRGDGDLLAYGSAVGRENAWRDCLEYVLASSSAAAWLPPGLIAATLEELELRLAVYGGRGGR